MLCEFGAVLAKLHRQKRLDEAMFQSLEAIRARLPPVMPSPTVIDNGIALCREFGTSYWDAMLIAACRDAGVGLLFSEDIQSQPKLLGVTIENPFKGFGAKN